MADHARPLDRPLAALLAPLLLVAVFLAEPLEGGGWAALRGLLLLSVLGLLAARFVRWVRSGGLAVASENRAAVAVLAVALGCNAGASAAFGLWIFAAVNAAGAGVLVAGARRG